MSTTSDDDETSLAQNVKHLDAEDQSFETRLPERLNSPELCIDKALIDWGASSPAPLNDSEAATRGGRFQWRIV